MGSCCHYHWPQDILLLLLIVPTRWTSIPYLSLHITLFLPFVSVVWLSCASVLFALYLPILGFAKFLKIHMDVVCQICEVLGCDFFNIASTSFSHSSFWGFRYIYIKAVCYVPYLSYVLYSALHFIIFSLFASVWIFSISLSSSSLILSSAMSNLLLKLIQWVFNFRYYILHF